MFVTARGTKLDRVTEAFEAFKKAVAREGLWEAEDLKGPTAKDFRYFHEKIKMITIASNLKFKFFINYFFKTLPFN